jgi:hypothetical protein
VAATIRGDLDDAPYATFADGCRAREIADALISPPN